MAEEDQGPPVTPGGSASASALTPGQRVGAGRYTLVRQLGQGGMGTVWLAKDEQLGDEVALKFLAREISHDAETLDELRRETLKSRKLTHTHIIRIHDLHQVPGEAPFISMEYVAGQSLSKFKAEQSQRCFNWDYLKPLVKQLCDALDYAHGEQVIHRDLKPANLMLDARGRLKLADFGLAAVVSESMSRTSRQRSTSGTPAYMSPQQMDGRPPRVTDDIYALGATLYELLTSKPPFYHGDVLHQVRNLPPDPLEQRLAEFHITNDVPPDVAALIMACLAKNPEQRPQSAGAVAEWIGITLGTQPTGQILARAEAVRPRRDNGPEEPAVVAASEEAGVPAAVPGSKAGLWVGLSLAALLLVIFGSWLVMRNAGKTEMPTPKLPSTLSTVDGTVIKTGSALLAENQVERIEANDLTAVVPAPATLSSGQRWTNTLGMVFTDVPGMPALFSIWETRVQDYEVFAKATSRSWPKPDFTQGPTHPAVIVGWDDAKVFCQWLTEKERSEGKLGASQSYRLPTDAEWSLAVGLPQESGATPAEKSDKIKDVYPWGNQWPPPKGAGNYPAPLAVDDFRNTAPVGSFAANRYGLYDLGGNISEWCEDEYRPGSGTRVLRGGSWGGGRLDYYLASHRLNGLNPGLRNEYGGFRCVLVGVSASLPAPPARSRTASSTVSAAQTRAIDFTPVTLPSGQRWTNTLGMVFTRVPGTPSLFSIWETRVQDYEAFAKATNRSWGKSPFTQSPTHAAEGVSWDDAKAFCQWLTEKERSEGKLEASQSYRLPTDAEWSLAVGLPQESGATPAAKHAKINGVYPWGNQWPPRKGTGNYGKPLGVDTFDNTSPVGNFAANRYGLYDLSGNVWEWCEDEYSPGSGTRVLRGGSWTGGGSRDFLLSSFRSTYTSVHRRSDFGFRCAVVSVSASLPAPPALSMATSSRVSAPPATAIEPIPATLSSGQRWTNTLGMVFTGVTGTPALFSIWETRVQDYEAFVKATGRSWVRPEFIQGPTHPAVNVSWHDAKAFCQWLTEQERNEGKLVASQSYRLPTNEEWSLAVGLREDGGATPAGKVGQTQGVYPWGDQWPPPKGAGNYDPALGVDNFDNTAPVGSFAANRYGLYDLGGNAWEWCEDEYGPVAGTRVLRGGAWGGDNPGNYRTVYRGWNIPGRLRDVNGFRVVLGGVLVR